MSFWIAIFALSWLAITVLATWFWMMCDLSRFYPEDSENKTAPQYRGDNHVSRRRRIVITGREYIGAPVGRKKRDTSPVRLLATPACSYVGRRRSVHDPRNRSLKRRSY